MSKTKRNVDTHWDFVLKEALWLANDFRNERTRLVGNAKKAVKMTEQYHKTKDAKILKQAKDEVLARKKIAATISRDVRQFWMKINKLVAYKQKLEADSIRQKAMDQHLVYLVKQTERYTQMLTDEMQSSAPNDKPEHNNEKQNGETMSGAERTLTMTSVSPTPSLASTHTGTDAIHKSFFSSNSLNALDTDDLNSNSTGNKRRRLAPTVGSDSEISMDVDSDEDYKVESEEEDDETSLLEAEALAMNNMDATREEVAMLTKESDMSMDQLLAMYKDMQETLSDSESDADEEEEDEDDMSDSNSEAGGIVIKASSDAGANSSGSTDGSTGAGVGDSATATASASTDNPTEIVAGNSMDVDSDEDYKVESEEEDDETSLLEAEALAMNNMDATREEVAMLTKESDMSMDQLLAMYKDMQETLSDSESDADEEEEDEDEDDMSDSS